MSAWRLKTVTISNLLGYQGEKTFQFSEGLQVVEAPNHTGKTSLTLSVLWTLTGVIPQLARINRQSFRLTNKHSGGDSVQFCQIELTRDDQRSLVIKRVYSGPRPDWEQDLNVEMEDASLSGQQAQLRILQELRLKPGSLEGCGVVLQDHRLGFITSKDSDISDVLNDMLGLTVLSQLVPLLDERAKMAKDLHKEVSSLLETADPLVRWQQRDEELRKDFQKRENEAIAAGFTRDQMDDPAATAVEQLGQAAQKLDSPVPEPGVKLLSAIQMLRAQLDTLRKTSPLGLELVRLQARNNQIEQWFATAESLRSAYGSLGKEVAEVAATGEMDGAILAQRIAGFESGLQANRQQREVLEEQNGLLTKAYHHLLGHQELGECPVCGGDVPAQELLKQVKSRLETGVADLLGNLKLTDKTLADQMADAEKRLKLVKGLKDKHREQCEQIEAFRRRLQDESFAWGAQPDSDDLFLDGNQSAALLASLDHAIGEIGKLQLGLAEQAIRKQDEAARQESSRFQPAEKQITRVSEILVPVIASAGKVEAHGALRDQANDRKTALEMLRDEAQAAAGHIQKIAKALASHEEQAASAAVRARLPEISGFFKSVTGNPDYDKLDVQTSVSRDKVAYKILAASSTIGNLNDAVGHVLSEGDLSAASMALLVGLASGESHHLGFLMLDDPAQGMDETLQANLAKAVVALGKPKQIIILTHQRTFAEALAQAGAQYSKIHSWHLGRVQDG